MHGGAESAVCIHLARSGISLDAGQGTGLTKAEDGLISLLPLLVEEAGAVRWIWA